MKRTLYRLMHNRDGKFLNPLMHIFFYITLVNGLFFSVFSFTNGVQESVLYKHTQDAFGTAPLPIWGVCAMLVVAINTAAIYFRHRTWLGTGGMLGFLVWAFAFFIYMQDGLWFQMAGVALPNLLFWTWYYFRVKWYYKN